MSTPRQDLVNRGITSEAWSDLSEANSFLYVCGILI